VAAFITPHFQLYNTPVVQIFIHIWAELILVFISKIFRCQRMNVEYLNTLWTGDADLRLCITTVEDG